jgi:hypothetical protein
MVLHPFLLFLSVPTLGRRTCAPYLTSLRATFAPHHTSLRATLTWFDLRIARPSKAHVCVVEENDRHRRAGSEKGLLLDLHDIPPYRLLSLLTLRR